MSRDRAVVQFSAGKGGNGVVAWRREKFIPKGGPSGGNGGNGGSVFIKASTDSYSLDFFKNRTIVKAENGQQGQSACKTGRNGKDLILEVPCGTLIKEVKTGKVLCDLTEKGQVYLLCKGGRGGKGNFHFRSPTNRAPQEFTLGTPGESKDIELELKLIADVGLVGFPNAGKSTLINQMAHLRVRVGAYPFTTLHPNIGFFEVPSGKRVYIADIPGLIHGASQNRGLGHDFLRHVERTRLLVFMLDASSYDGHSPVEAFTTLKKELSLYSPELLERPRIVVLNKRDIEESTPFAEEFISQFGNEEKVFFISALIKEDLSPLSSAIAEFFSQE